MTARPRSIGERSTANPRRFAGVGLSRTVYERRKNARTCRTAEPCLDGAGCLRGVRSGVARPVWPPVSRVRAEAGQSGEGADRIRTHARRGGGGGRRGGGGEGGQYWEGGNEPATAGSANTGGGAGGGEGHAANDKVGPAGGSGIVVIRYLTASVA